MSKEMSVIPVDRVVDLKRIIGKMYLSHLFQKEISRFILYNSI
jgi:hypothetical protein